MKKQKSVLLIAVVSLVCGIVNVGWLQGNDKHRELCVPEQREQRWITVFIHGTYGSALGMLSAHHVFRDKTEGTLYHKLQKILRNNELFYSNRLMSEPGLVKLNTKFLQENQAQRVSTLLVSSYHKIAQEVNPGIGEDYFTFGWNGLLSQTERRREALRLYNELSAEVALYHAQGVEPKVRLVCHSHGGNVALNLASIYENLREAKSAKFSADAMQQMGQLLSLSKLSTFPYSYPEGTSFSIDELVLYATPIQVETEGFAFSPIFKHVYNLFSENDVVQTADILSTKARKSSRKISMKKRKKEELLHVTQAQIVVNRKIGRRGRRPVRRINLKAVLRGGKLISEHPQDPAHADFWCVSWSKQELFFDPLPLVVFTPVLLKALENHTGSQNLAVNITRGNVNSFCMMVLDNHEHAVLNKMQIPLSSIKKLSRALWKIKPRLSSSFSFLPSISE